MQFADAGAARFRRMVDDYVARAGIVAAEPDADPAERPEPGLEHPPESLGIRAERIAAVIWCTGFGPDTGWLRVPVLGPGGSPAHSRGITAFPGLYVAGYPWLSTRGSGLLYGVAADAARVAQHIAAAAHSGRAPQPVAHRPSPGAPAHPHSVPAAAPAGAGTSAGPAGAQGSRATAPIHRKGART